MPINNLTYIEDMVGIKIHMYNEILLTHKKEILPFVAMRMNLGNMPNEINQTEKTNTV